MINLSWKKRNSTAGGEKKTILKVKNNESGERSRWKAEWLKEQGDEMTESLTTIAQLSWGRKTGALTIERDINRVTIKRRWIKRKKIIDDNLKLKKRNDTAGGEKKQSSKWIIMNLETDQDEKQND